MCLLDQVQAAISAASHVLIDCTVEWTHTPQRSYVQGCFLVSVPEKRAVVSLLPNLHLWVVSDFRVLNSVQSWGCGKYWIHRTETHGVGTLVFTFGQISCACHSGADVVHFAALLTVMSAACQHSLLAVSCPARNMCHLKLKLNQETQAHVRQIL